MAREWNTVRRRAALFAAVGGSLLIFAVVARILDTPAPAVDVADCIDCPASESAEFREFAAPAEEPDGATDEDRTAAVSLDTGGEDDRPDGCLECHPDIDRQSGSFDGVQFAHSAHVGVRLPCTRCHTSFDSHGGIRLGSSADCGTCHHAGAIPCGACHTGDRLPPRQLTLEAGDFSHDIHGGASLSCTECHETRARADAAQCQSCHDVHHRQEAMCGSCHREGAQHLHTVSVHTTPCASCHGDRITDVAAWSRNICESCHAGRSEHFPASACGDCHVLPAMGD